MFPGVVFAYEANHAGLGLPAERREHTRLPRSFPVWWRRCGGDNMMDDVSDCIYRRVLEQLSEGDREIIEAKDGPQPKNHYDPFHDLPAPDAYDRKRYADASRRFWAVYGGEINSAGTRAPAATSPAPATPPPPAAPPTTPLVISPEPAAASPD